MQPSILLLLGAVTLCQGQGALQTTTITFEGPPEILPGGYSMEPVYYESGAWFRADPLGVQFQRSWWYFPDNGSTHLRANIGVIFSLTNGAPFDLISVDLAEYATGIGNPATVHVVGYRADGATVVADFTTDGIIDGPGGEPDLETFIFGSGFSNLTSVEIPSFPYSTPYSLDNLVISIPEPSALGLFGVGGLLLVARRRVRWRGSA